MSGEYLGWAFQQVVPCHQKMVLVILGDGCGQEGESHFALGWLATRAGLSPAETAMALLDLRDHGLISHLGGVGEVSCVLCKPMSHEAPAKPVQGLLWLYVGRSGDATKIGVSKNLEQRFKSFNASMFVPVECVAAWHLREDYCRSLEKEMLQHFSKAKIKGEWVSVLPNAVIDEIDTRLVCSGMLEDSERVDFPLQKEGN